MATEQQVEQAKAELARALDGVPAETARSALHKVAEMYGLDDIGTRAIASDAVNRLGSQIAQHDRIIVDTKRKIEHLDKLKAWPTTELRLERNDCSRLHKLKQAMLGGRLLDGDENDTVTPPFDVFLKDRPTFVVKHDWASAFEKADVSGEFKLPYDLCFFEFRLCGRTCILWAQELNGKQSFTGFVESDEYWWSPPTPVNCEPWARFLWDQVRAICIALDAEVATHTVVRAPHKLNEKRVRAGKPKVSDFHVVDLARRHRVANPSGAMGTGSRKRLHWRRGHWRHFETSKTWVKWCLVGNPDLGFIQKSYSL